MTGPWWASAEGDVQVWLGDCLDVLRGMDACSVDAIVTDPPAGISFMQREWDDFRRARNPADMGRDDVFGRTSARGPEYGRRDRDQFIDWLTERLAEALRVLKPGGHALVWSIPRTAGWTHRAIEDAGFEIRDGIPHLFGSGFPKSRNVSADIDRMAGAEREVIGEGERFGRGAMHARSRAEAGYRPTERNPDGGASLITAPATEEAARWEGFGTSLKPGQELWWLARKPLGASTVAGNVLEWGTGALNIAGCKVGPDVDTRRSKGLNPSAPSAFPHSDDNWVPHVTEAGTETGGRWPANVVFSHSAACEPAGTRRVRSNPGGATRPGVGVLKHGGMNPRPHHADTGGETVKPRYADADGMETVTAWVCADDCPVGELDRQSGVTTSGAPRADRGSGGIWTAGDGVPCGPQHGDTGGASRFYPVFKYQAKAPASERPRLEDGTAHETVKPLGLISWLIRLITPPGGTVLDMFAGSGPVAEAAVVEGFRAVLIEQNPKSAGLIKTRLAKPIQPALFALPPDGAGQAS